MRESNISVSSKKTTVISIDLQFLTCFRFDPDNEGSINIQELRYIMSNLPIKVSEEEVEAILEAGDVNKDGKISFEEFRDMIGK